MLAVLFTIGVQLLRQLTPYPITEWATGGTYWASLAALLVARVQLLRQPRQRGNGGLMLLTAVAQSAVDIASIEVGPWVFLSIAYARPWGVPLTLG